MKKIADFISRILALGALIFVFIFFAGFFRYADQVSAYEDPFHIEKADGIVALTGGSADRLSKGIKLLSEGKGKRLLISGVYESATSADIRKISGGSKYLYDCCVDLGKTATSTIGNAKEIAIWAKRHNMDNIIIVTDNYHLPRSLLEIRAASKDVYFRGIAVKVAPFDNRQWWREPKAVRGLLVEYTKLFLVKIRVSLQDFLSQKKKAQND